MRLGRPTRGVVTTDGGAIRSSAGPQLRPEHQAALCGRTRKSPALRPVRVGAGASRRWRAVAEGPYSRHRRHHLADQQSVEAHAPFQFCGGGGKARGEKKRRPRHTSLRDGTASATVVVAAAQRRRVRRRVRGSAGPWSEAHMPIKLDAIWSTALAVQFCAVRTTPTDSGSSRTWKLAPLASLPRGARHIAQISTVSLHPAPLAKRDHQRRRRRLILGRAGAIALARYVLYLVRTYLQITVRHVGLQYRA